MKIDTPSSEQVLATLRRDGICLLEEVLAPVDAAIIRKETDWFLSTQRSWFRPDRQGWKVYASVSPRAVPRAELDRLRGMRSLFSQKFFETVCKRYLGDDAIIDRIIFSHSEPNARPITLWHANQQAEGRHRFKFMLYLTDTIEETGAFSYIPGSHKMMRKATKTAAAEGVRTPNFTLTPRFLRPSGATARMHKSDGFLKLAIIFAAILHRTISTVSLPRKARSSFLIPKASTVAASRHDARTLVRVHCFEPERRKTGLARRIIGNVRAAFSSSPFVWG